jgi:hypothetical protein
MFRLQGKPGGLGMSVTAAAHLLDPLTRAARRAVDGLAGRHPARPPLLRLAWRWAGPGLCRIGEWSARVDRRVAAGPPFRLLLFLLLAVLTAMVLREG